MLLTSEAHFGRSQPLEKVADRIVGHINLAVISQRDADFHRLAAGFLLLEARKRINGGWEAWCREHVDRSQRDVRKLIALASAVEPQRALEEERAATANRMKSLRQERAHVRPVQVIEARPVEVHTVEPAPVTIERPGYKSGPRRRYDGLVVSL